jgi:hypothetical protein
MLAHVQACLGYGPGSSSSWHKFLNHMANRDTSVFIPYLGLGMLTDTVADVMHPRNAQM